MLKYNTLLAIGGTKTSSYLGNAGFLFLLMAGAAWLVDNTINNLRALGKDFGFRFLWQTAGNDINQRLIE
jgi:general L-amino acid transport system permease protein